ncbi:MAG: ERCC4 domain-containing protein [Candidatus Desulfatibia sp.]|uniref:ERCC4 domain-containing protein n=1 Tax=Candidatus Desulfatibia sp. TaxID=3101189 RepID=UPI002F306DA3
MRITADYRESESGLIELLENRGVLLDTIKIPYGDYIINDVITVERKTAKDFLISIIDGRLFNQISNLKKYCTNPILLIEGNPYKTDHKFDRMAIKGAIISAQTIWYVPVIFSRSKEDSRDILLMISRQIETCIDVVPLRGGYRPKRLKSKQLYILQGLPQVGPKLAKRLMKHFKSVSNVMNASVQTLTEVDGIGKVTAEKIRAVLDAEIS